MQHALLYIVDFAISGWMKQKTKQNKQKRSLVKSNGMKTSLSLFCTLKQNQLPLACLGVEGEGSTQKPCNYSVLAQQQRAKGASKAFLWANSGSLRGKMQPVHEYHCMDFGPLQRHKRQKMCASVSMGVTVHNHFDYLIVQSASPVLLQEVLRFLLLFSLLVFQLYIFSPLIYLCIKKKPRQKKHKLLYWYFLLDKLDIYTILMTLYFKINLN